MYRYQSFNLVRIFFSLLAAQYVLFFFHLPRYSFFIFPPFYRLLIHILPTGQSVSVVNTHVFVIAQYAHILHSSPLVSNLPYRSSFFQTDSCRPLFFKKNFHFNWDVLLIRFLVFFNNNPSITKNIYFIVLL